MKILILSFYYHPDLCPGSFRCTALVEQLLPLVKGNYEIDVITTAPNRYASFNVEALEVEQQPGVTIRRIMLPSHCSGMLDQAKAFAYFAKEVNKLVRDNDYALVFATSSRLMTALLGAFIARRKKAKFYLDIRDIFIDTLADILPKKISIGAKPFFSFLEKWAFTRAQRINLISRGFEGHFNKRYPRAKLSWFTNGIDQEFVSLDENAITNESLSKPLTVLYAGNMGEGQGLHTIVPTLAKHMEGRVKFKLIGDGGRKSQLESAIRAANCNNIELLPPISRSQLIKEYQDADVLFLHLNDYDAFRKVLPSKLFEYAAMGKPIWAGVSGYAAEFVKTEISNVAIFNPCNVSEALESFDLLKIENTPREEFIKKYRRHNIMQLMAVDVMSLLL